MAWIIREVKRNLTILTKIGPLFAAILLILPVSLANAQSSAVKTSSSSEFDNSLAIQFESNTPLIRSEPKTIAIEMTESAYERKLRENRLARQRAKQIAKTVPASVPNDVSPQEKRDWVKRAAETFSIDWKVLEAVWQVESGKRWQSGVRSGAGATGPCQFMPGTWRAYAQDGNGDGNKNITDARDCLYGAAKLLAVNGASSGKVDQALLRYNRSLSYVRKVSNLANSLE